MTPIPEEFIIAKGKAAEEYKERCKVDRDSGHLADCDFSEGAEWAYRLLSSQGLRWVKCTERMPQLPNPLPADTPDERPVIFFNLRHSSTGVWFPSYGIKAEDQFPLEANINRTLYDQGFGREYWEWLDESTAPIQQTMRWVKGDELPEESDYYISEVVSNVGGVQTGNVKYLQYIKGADHFLGLHEHERVVRWLLEPESAAPIQ